MQLLGGGTRLVFFCLFNVWNAINVHQMLVECMNAKENGVERYWLSPQHSFSLFFLLSNEIMQNSYCSREICPPSYSHESPQIIQMIQNFYQKLVCYEKQTLQSGWLEEGKTESREDPSPPGGEGGDSCSRMVESQSNCHCPSQDTNHVLVETAVFRGIQNIGISSFFLQPSVRFYMNEISSD